MSVHARARGSRAGDTLWQCLNKVSTPACHPLALVPRPNPPVLGIPVEHPAPAGPHSTCSGNRGCPRAPFHPCSEGSPKLAFPLGKGKEPREGAEPAGEGSEPPWGSQGHDWLLLRCSRERERPCGDSLDALRGIPWAEIPAGSSELLPISADNSSCLARQALSLAVSLPSV